MITNEENSRKKSTIVSRTISDQIEEIIGGAQTKTPEIAAKKGRNTTIDLRKRYRKNYHSLTKDHEPKN